MFRLLFWIALIAAAFWLWRKLKRKRPTPKAEPNTTPMVRCSQCGLHVPQTQALQTRNRWYCSRAHLEQDSRHLGD